MHALNILAEAKMRQWEKDREAGKTSLQSGRQLVIGKGQSLERQLYDDIRSLIQQSQSEPPATRQRLLQSAERLQVQLTVRLEQGGYHHVAKWYGDEILRLKQEMLRAPDALEQQ